MTRHPQKIICHRASFQLPWRTQALNLWATLGVQLGIPKHPVEEEMEIHPQEILLHRKFQWNAERKGTPCFLTSRRLCRAARAPPSMLVSHTPLHAWRVRSIPASQSMAGADERAAPPNPCSRDTSSRCAAGFLRAEQVSDYKPGRDAGMRGRACARGHRYTGFGIGVVPVWAPIGRHSPPWTMTRTDKGNSPEVTCPRHHGPMPLESHQLLQAFFTLENLGVGLQNAGRALPLSPPNQLPPLAARRGDLGKGCGCRWEKAIVSFPPVL